MLHVTVDVVLVLCDYARSAVTLLNLAVTLVGNLGGG
jgi:hypothetical protein